LASIRDDATERSTAEAGRNPLFELSPTADGHYSLDLTPDLARFDGRLFGGAGLAASVAAIEERTGRVALWTTVQFVGTAEIGDRIDCHAEVLAEGHNTTQARVTGTTGGRIVFVALGSAARPRDDGFGAAYGQMPRTTGPDESAPWKPEFPFPPETIELRGPFATAEFRDARCDDGSRKLWARIKAGPQSRVTIAYLADFVPSAVLRAAGRSGGGVSLDNSIRFGMAPPSHTDWVLIDTEPYLADSGYVHGGARLWSVEGTLLAVASQTAVAKFFD
jgi:acyl-CoA thioesterase II